MTDDLMTIRVMCDTYNVTPRTLRFYEAKELLHPIRDGQKRLFTNRDRARLKLILRGKRFGFPLEDIRQLLDLYDMASLRHTQVQRAYDLGLKRMEEMKQQFNELAETIAELKKQLELGEQMLSAQAQSTAA
ncbi:MAG: MerR family transcriptional regulator [Marinosulfonomonas sp.]|nr:MAG: MerR family transcriptional regulator [Marinosulfonomonas sp.]